MRAGKLNNRIRLLRPIVVRDDRTGGSVKSYEFVAEVWADAEPISNRKIARVNRGRWWKPCCSRCGHGMKLPLIGRWFFSSELYRSCT